MKKPLLAATLAAVFAAGALSYVGAQAPAVKKPAAPNAMQTPRTPGAPAQDASKARIESLVTSMTLDEKISMLYGVTDPTSYGQAGYLPGVPRLGIPPLRLSDGPAGIRTAQPATALPAPVAMAATFSPEMAKQYGQIIRRDARARHQNVVLGPMVNIVRVPQGGRNFETLGEDPFLAGRLVAAEVEGIQGEGSIATVKHYAFNNQENGRAIVSADVDEQTGREIELAGFEAAIRAGAGSVMCSYNKVNGDWACESVPLLTAARRRCADCASRTLPRCEWTGRLLGGHLRGLSLVRPAEARAAVPVRPRAVLHDLQLLGPERAPGGRRLRHNVHDQEHRNA